MENVKNYWNNLNYNLNWTYFELLFLDLFYCENYFDKNVSIILLIGSTENWKKQV